MSQKLVYYVKKERDVKFVQCHMFSGKIRMKNALANGDKNEGVGDWITIISSENLFKPSVDLDFEKLYYKLLLFNFELNLDANE